MKKISKRLLAAACAVVLLVSLVPSAAAAERVPSGNTMSAESAELAAATNTIWLVGDSTVCAFNDAYYYPRYGYGTQIGTYVDSTYKVENLALSGRSSRSFPVDEPENGEKGGKVNYERLMANITSGDVLVVGFGHNDEKADDRYTNPNGDWQTEGSFANSLWVNYVEPAQAKGAEVILCTPVVRVPAPGNTAWSDSEFHVTADATANGVTYKGGDYPAAVRKLGQDKNVAVVDLTAATKALYEEVGFAEALYFHAWTNTKLESVDKTHLNIYGAKAVAWLFANGVKDNTVSTTLASHIDLTAVKPTKAGDLVSNPDYVELPYTPPQTGSENWSAYKVFQPTAFGDIGTDAPSNTTYFMEKDQDGNLHMKGTGKGKIGGSADGIMMYYYPVPVGKTFTLSATATINGFSSGANTTTLPNQSGFGLMARDDMWIDKKDATIKSDYVVAGSCANSSGPCGSFYRKNTTVKRTALTVETVEKGKSYDLSIVYNGDGYACKFGNEPAQSGGFDFQLTSVDSQYVYVGMFATREAEITFSNIRLVVDGETLCDTRPEGCDVAVADGGWKVEGGVLTSVSAACVGRPETALVLAVSYDDSGKMTGLKTLTVKNGEMAVGLPVNAGGKVKIFSLDKEQNAPLMSNLPIYNVPGASGGAE